MDQYRTTSSVARELKISRSTLDRFLDANRELRPPMFSGRFLWSEGAFRRVREALVTRA